MPRKRRIGIITYNGIDGACAAAALLLHHPEADVTVSSAAKIGRTLMEVAGSRKRYGEIHVCGVGVAGEHDEIADAVRKLTTKGTAVIWHCGRGYLDDRREWFETFCKTAFRPTGSNTAALTGYLGLEKHDRAVFLRRLALHDTRVETAPRKPLAVEANWLDLIAWSILQYFKFDDREALPATIRKLAFDVLDHNDLRAIEIYKLSGDKYILLGRSRAIRDLRRLVALCAAADEPVLITGESGTGKELVAQLIRDGSSRALESFVPVNCAMFRGNTGLANSILFGHRRGAFTGAVGDRRGKFPVADSGILFLDEIGELPLEVQTKLLRVLQDGAIEPEGADRPQQIVDVRVIVATNRNLAGMIRSGAFRDDLFHRLSTLVIHAPPLRDRPGDIDVLAGEFLSALHGEDDQPRRLSSSDLEALHAYEWPGNVRQLQKVMRTAYHLKLPVHQVMARERRWGLLRAAAPETLSVHSLPDSGGRKEPVPIPADRIATSGFLPGTVDEIRSMDEVKREYALQSWRLLGENWSATARALGITVNTLKSWLREKHG